MMLVIVGDMEQGVNSVGALYLDGTRENVYIDQTAEGGE